MTAGWRQWQQSYPACRMSGIVTIHKSFDFALVEMHIRQRPDFIRSLPLPPNKFGFVNLPDVQDLPYVYRSIYSVRDG